MNCCAGSIVITAGGGSYWVVEPAWDGMGWIEKYIVKTSRWYWWWTGIILQLETINFEYILYALEMTLYVNPVRNTIIVESYCEEVIKYLIKVHFVSYILQIIIEKNGYNSGSYICLLISESNVTSELGYVIPCYCYALKGFSVRPLCQESLLLKAINNGVWSFELT